MRVHRLLCRSSLLPCWHGGRTGALPCVAELWYIHMIWRISHRGSVVLCVRVGSSDNAYALGIAAIQSLARAVSRTSGTAHYCARASTTVAVAITSYFTPCCCPPGSWLSLNLVVIAITTCTEKPNRMLKRSSQLSLLDGTLTLGSHGLSTEPSILSNITCCVLNRV